MGVGVHARLVLDRLGQVAPGELVAPLGRRLEQPDDGVDQRQGDELAPAAVDAGEVGDEGVVGVDDHVDRGADQDLREDVEDLVEHRQRRRQDDLRPVARRVAPEPEEGGGVAVVDRGAAAHAAPAKSARASRPPLTHRVAVGQQQGVEVELGDPPVGVAELGLGARGVVHERVRHEAQRVVVGQPDHPVGDGDRAVGRDVEGASRRGRCRPPRARRPRRAARRRGRSPRPARRRRTRAARGGCRAPGSRSARGMRPESR